MQLATLFSTPIASFDHKDLTIMNEELSKIMVAESLTKPSISVSNVGNWHSENNLEDRTEPCFQQLVELIKTNAWKTSEALLKKAGQTYPTVQTNLSMWCMVMREGNYTKPHTHPNAHWAVVYYPDVGDSGEGGAQYSGDIAFVDPRMAYLPVPGIDAQLGDFQVTPKTGQMLVFPGWLSHYVHTYKGNKPRISIACNVTYSGIPPTQ